MFYQYSLFQSNVIIFLLRMSRSNKPRPRQIDETVDFNDESLLEGDNSNSFDLKNQLYELRSRCNAIQYEKNKLHISYENALKEIKHKNALLQRYRRDPPEKDERGGGRQLSQLRYQCQALADENDMLKRQLQTAFEKNRSTPNFNSQDYALEMSAFDELMQKEERIKELEKDVKEIRKRESEAQEKVGGLMKENGRLKDMVKSFQDMERTVRVMNKETEERHRQISKFKIDNSKLIELNKTVESEKQQAIRKIILLQEEVGRWEREVSEVRASLFNQKLQSKKAMNSLRFQVEGEMSRCRGLVEQTGQQNRRLRDQILALSDQNQGLRQKELSSSQKLDFLRKEHTALQLNSREMNSNLLNLQAIDRSIDLRGTKQTEYQFKIIELQQQLKNLRTQLNQKKDNAVGGEELKRLNELQQDLKYKQEMVQLMKMDKGESVAREKELLERIREMQAQLAEKQKAIEAREEQIKRLKDDNRYLQLGNEELKEKMETLQTVMVEVDTINRQIKKQKLYLDEKRREEKLLKEEERQMADEVMSPGKRKPVNLSRRSSGDSDVKGSRLSKRGSMMDVDLQKQVQDLTNENYKLRVKLSSAQNQVDRKALDLNIIKKSYTNLPQTILGLPVDSAKKINPHTAGLQNKIQELEKEIAAYRMAKQQGQSKHAFSKQTEDKYQLEIKRLNLYCQQLSKNIDLLNEKLEQETRDKQQTVDQLQALQEASFAHEQQYSDTLTQFNQLLHEYKMLKQRYENSTRQQECGHEQEMVYLKGTIDKLLKNYNDKNMMLDNAYDQIRRLNELLMSKEHELKKSQGHSSHMKSLSGSLVSHDHPEQMSLLMLRLTDHEKSFDPRGSLSTTRRHY